MLNKIETEPLTHQHQDDNRLENIQACLNRIKNGAEALRISALDQIEQILLRIHKLAVL